MPAPYSVFHRLVVSVSCSHMRCPVGALRTPHFPRAFLRAPTQIGPAERDRSAASVGGDHHNPLAHRAKAPPPRASSARAGPIPRSAFEALIPSASPGHSASAKQVRAPRCLRRSFRTLRLCAIPGVSPRAGIGVGMAAIGHPSLRTGRADFPHPALQSVSHPLAAGLVRSARAKAYREISPCFSKNALG
jgi:hypothetical protein